MAPGLFVFAAAILAPILLSVYYGFTDYSGIGKSSFIGLDNYKTLFQDSVFWTALRNSLFLAIGFICIQHPLAMLTAIKLDKLQERQRDCFAVFSLSQT